MAVGSDGPLVFDFQHRDLVTRLSIYWNVDRFVDGFHKIYIIERNSSERIYVVRWEIDKNPDDITSRSHVA